MVAQFAFVVVIAVVGVKGHALDGDAAHGPGFGEPGGAARRAES
jgi:hypothetical protein